MKIWEEKLKASPGISSAALQREEKNSKSIQRQA